jgi:hypothetical protein
MVRPPIDGAAASPFASVQTIPFICRMIANIFLIQGDSLQVVAPQRVILFNAKSQIEILIRDNIVPR